MKRLTPVVWILLLLLCCGCATESNDAGDDDDSNDAPTDDDDDDTSPTDDDDTSPTDDDDDDQAPPLITWVDCGEYFPSAWLSLIPPETLCGQVAAPLDYTRLATGDTLAARFAFVPARTAHPRGVLAANFGGPHPNLRNLVLFGLKPDALAPAGLSEDFHLLFVETRGSSMSSTPLECPGLQGKRYLTLARYRRLVRRCLQSTTHGVSPALMSTADAASDMDLVRRALGVTRLHLLGNSYGTRLMLEYLRRFPEHVAAYVLDSTLPPQSSGLHNLDEVLDQLAHDCDASERCPFASGDELVAATDTLLNQTMPADDFGRGLTQDLFHLGDHPALLDAWPRVLAATTDGNWDPLAAWHEYALPVRAAPTELETEQRRFAWDPYGQNVMCIDFPGWNDFVGREFVLTRLTPPYIPLAQIEATTHIACEELAATYDRPPTVNREPVVADVPGLLVAPRFDQATPSGDAFLAAAQGLSGASVVTINADHAVLLDLGEPTLGLSEDDQQCLRALVTDWLAAPFDPFSRDCVARLAAPLPLAAP